MISAFFVKLLSFCVFTFLSRFVAGAEVARYKRLYGAVKALRSGKAEDIDEHAAHAHACKQQGVICLPYEYDVHLAYKLKEDVSADWR